MAKKVTVILLTLILVAVCCVSFAACDGNNSDRLTIVYVGDSIAEALIGPSPLAERDNYGYYAVVGKINNFRYFNHSVSGHKTSTGMVPSNDKNDIGGLLGMLTRNDENAALMKSHLQQADIIHISVLGNNILQYNLGLLFWEIAQPDFETRFQEGEGDTLLDLLYTGSREVKTKPNGDVVYDENGREVYKPFEANEINTRPSLEKEGEVVQFDFPPTYKDLCDAIARIRELNPDAQIIFQTVYNPFFDGSVHLHKPVVEKLATVKDEEGRFGPKGAYLTDITQFRKIADRLLDILNALVFKYRDSHPEDKNFHVLDINKEFDDVVNEKGKDANGNVDLSENCYGRRLIYEDWTHPSNLGHAIIACATQEMLEEELHLADKDALANYKKLRVDQLERLYTGVEGVKIDEIKTAINAAENMKDATFAYFDGIYGYTPINY